jgi:Flp pilus assembly protein TadG
VEFALVLPLLILFLFVVLDFGFLVYNKAVITNASREAARTASMLTATPWTTANVALVACNYARNLVITTNSGTRTATCTGTADPVIVVSNPNGNVPPLFTDPVTVGITYRYSGFLINKSNPWTNGTSMANLTASTTMRHE